MSLEAACWLKSHTGNGTNGTSRLYYPSNVPSNTLWDGYCHTVLQQTSTAMTHCREATLSAHVSLSADSQRSQSLFMRVRICSLDVEFIAGLRCTSHQLPPGGYL